MPYDPKLDQRIWGKTWENDLGKISVGIFSYNQGAKKLQITRENTDAEGNVRFAKLGRLTQDELEGILPILEEARKQFAS
ncbi:MAG: hypothetical protein A2Z83_00710 [Omnitrophica bacterium GWA2_52_8]|nr:MAG: hypothetical protein A2Z83_00710 [Omnitrophica bacterium GWA2_52_8]